MFLHIYGGTMEGISNMQKNWKKCGVVEAVDTVLNLPVRLNPVTRDSKEAQAFLATFLFFLVLFLLFIKGKSMASLRYMAE